MCTYILAQRLYIGQRTRVGHVYDKGLDAAFDIRAQVGCAKDPNGLPRWTMGAVGEVTS